MTQPPAPYGPPIGTAFIVLGGRAGRRSPAHLFARSLTLLSLIGLLVVVIGAASSTGTTGG